MQNCHLRKEPYVTGFIVVSLLLQTSATKKLQREGAAVFLLLIYYLH